jgi:hypothetical protein
MPFWSVMTMFSSARPSTANLRIFWMPSTFLRFWARSEPGLGKMMTLAVTGFWSCWNSSFSGITIVTLALSTSSRASICWVTWPMIARRRLMLRSKSVVVHFCTSKMAQGSVPLGYEVVPDEDALGPERVFWSLT